MRTIIRDDYDPVLNEYHDKILIDTVREKVWIFDCDGVFTDFTSNAIVENERGDSKTHAASQDWLTRELVALESRIGEEELARLNADGVINIRIDDVISDLDTERNERKEEDAALEEKIEAIEAASDVVDVVGTHAELETYDTSKLGDNDIIKVLKDETHSDATTYYRWNKTTSQFGFVGEEGPYYTQTQVNELLDEKQDTLTPGDNIEIEDGVISAVVPTVNDGTLTFTRDGETLGTFSANSAEDVTIEIPQGGGSEVTLYEEVGQNTDGALTQKAASEMVYTFDDDGNVDGVNVAVVEGTSTNHSIALGDGASAEGSKSGTVYTGSIAIGKGASSNGGGTAIGSGATAKDGGTSSVALGSASSTQGGYEAIGAGSNATQGGRAYAGATATFGGIAFGGSASSSEGGIEAIGNSSRAKSGGRAYAGATAESAGLAFGNGASATQGGADAIGTGSVSTGSGRAYAGGNASNSGYAFGGTASSGYAVALGKSSTASGPYSLSAGYSTTAAGTNSTAIGYGSSTSSSAQNAVALGGANARNTNGIAIGSGAKTETVAQQNFRSQIAIGSSAECSNSSLMAIGPTAAANGSNAVAIGIVTAGNNSVAIGADNSSATEQSVAVGQGGIAAKNSSVALGYAGTTAGRDASGSVTKSEKCVAIGYSVKATGNSSISIGSQNNISSANAISIGSSASALGERAIAIGTNASCASTKAIAIGKSTAAAAGNIAIGESAVAGSANTVAIGESAYAGPANSVAIGNNSTATADNTFAVGSPTNLRKVTSVADGTANNDAVNVSQLNTLSDRVDELAMAKAPNVVIIGEPTLNQGQASDFSAFDYLQFPFILDLTGKTFQIDFCFTTGDDVTTQQNIIDSKYGIALAIQNGHGVMAISSDGQTWNIGTSTGTFTIAPNTTYFARLSWDGTTYRTALSTNGTSYTDDMSIVSSVAPFPTTHYIGGANDTIVGHTVHPFAGVIDLNKSSMTINGELYWEGMDSLGLLTRADVSLSNIDAAGEERIRELATIPVASADTLGGIKVGQNLTISEDGTLNAQAGGATEVIEMFNLDTATAQEIADAITASSGETTTAIEVMSVMKYGFRKPDGSLINSFSSLRREVYNGNLTFEYKVDTGKMQDLPFLSRIYTQSTRATTVETSLYYANSMSKTNINFTADTEHNNKFWYVYSNDSDDDTYAVTMSNYISEDISQEGGIGAGFVMEDVNGDLYMGNSQDETKKISPNEKELTQAEYDALTDEQKNNGTTYYITDAEPTPAKLTYFYGENSSHITGAWSTPALIPNLQFTVSEPGVYFISAVGNIGSEVQSVPRVSIFINETRGQYSAILLTPSLQQTWATQQVSTLNAGDVVSVRISTDRNVSLFEGQRLIVIKIA